MAGIVTGSSTDSCAQLRRIVVCLQPFWLGVTVRGLARHTTTHN